MLKTPSCCCLALDVLAGKDLLKSSFIADIPSSHNSFLKTLTGIIMQGSPEDALNYTRGAAWPWARQGEGVSVLVFLLSLTIAWPILKHQLYCTSNRQRFHSSVKFLHSSLSERTIPNWIYDCRHSFGVLERPDLLRDLLHGNGEQRFGQRSPVVCWESAPMRSVKQHVAPVGCLGMQNSHIATWTTLQCPLPPPQCSREECLLSVFGTQYHCIHLKLGLAYTVLHELENCTWHSRTQIWRNSFKCLRFLVICLILCPVIHLAS